MRPAPLSSRLGTKSTSSSVTLKRTTKMAAFDVLGTALYQVVLHHDDIHRLVASSLAESSAEVAAGYVSARLEAEAIAHSEADVDGRQTLAISNIADHLPILLDDRVPLLKRGRLARKAIRTELELERLLSRANPEAAALIDEATSRRIAVAFIADSYLPRDLVSRMLSDAHYPVEHLLVSSQEGVTQAAGELLPRLAKRAGLALRDITYIGPEAPAVSDRSLQPAYATSILTSPRASADNLLGSHTMARSGAGGLALALAADRLGSTEDKPEPADIGYYAAGPLAAGFAAWVGVQVDDLSPDHVLFTGPARLLLRRIFSIMRPELDQASFHAVPATIPNDQPETGSSPIESIGIDDDHVVLVVDLGLGPAPHLGVAQACEAAGLNVEVVGAQLTTSGPFSEEQQPDRVWAPNVADDRSAQPVFEALLSPLTRPGAKLDVIGTEIDLRAANDLTLGIDSFAEDFEPLVCLDRNCVGPALVGPALRILHAPNRAEASIVGASMIADGTIDEAWPQGFAQLKRTRSRFQRSKASRDEAISDTSARSSMMTKRSASATNTESGGSEPKTKR